MRVAQSLLEPLPDAVLPMLAFNGQLNVAQFRHLPS